MAALYKGYEIKKTKAGFIVGKIAYATFEDATAAIDWK